MSGKRSNLVCATVFEAKNAEKMANSSRETRREIIRATSLGNPVKPLFIPEFPFASESYVNFRSTTDIYSRFFGLTYGWRWWSEIFLQCDFFVRGHIGRMDGDGIVRHRSENRPEIVSGIALEVDRAVSWWAGAGGYRRTGAAGGFLFWRGGRRCLAEQRCRAHLETGI